MIIGLPTLRLRGDYIAIVTLAFGEIIGRIAVNGDSVKIGGQRSPPAARASRRSTGSTCRSSIRSDAGPQTLVLVRAGPGGDRAVRELPPARLAARAARGSRCARTRSRRWPWASRSVKTKLLAYATGAAFGGISGAFLGSFLNTVNADQFQFSFSILVLGHDHPRRPRLDLGRRARRDHAVVHQQLPHPRRHQRRAEQARPRLRHDADHVRDLRLPAGDDDDPAPAGPAPRAAAQDGARRARRDVRTKPSTRHSA